MSTAFRAAAPQAAERAERAWVKGLGLAQHGQWHDAVTCFDQAHTEQPADVLYGLNLADARARQYLARQMENHFFGDGADAAQGYTPPAA